MRGSIAWTQPHRVTEVWIQAIRELGYPGCDLIKLNLQHRPPDCICFFAGCWSKQQLMPAFSDLPSLFRTNIFEARRLHLRRRLKMLRERLTLTSGCGSLSGHWQV